MEGLAVGEDEEEESSLGSGLVFDEEFADWLEEKVTL